MVIRPRFGERRIAQRMKELTNFLTALILDPVCHVTRPAFILNPEPDFGFPFHPQLAYPIAPEARAIYYQRRNVRLKGRAADEPIRDHRRLAS